MTVQNNISTILEELNIALRSVDEKRIHALKQMILESKRIFVAGAGRSLLMIRAFAMRLMHLGLTTYVVGETVTPALQKDDLLLIASGSGKTGSLILMAKKCKEVGAKLSLITTSEQSEIGKIADCVVRISASTPKVDSQNKTSHQPGANTFEQSVLLLGDSLVMDIIQTSSTHFDNNDLMKRHANLE